MMAVIIGLAERVVSSLRGVRVGKQSHTLPVLCRPTPPAALVSSPAVPAVLTPRTLTQYSVPSYRCVEEQNKTTHTHARTHARTYGLRLVYCKSDSVHWHSTFAKTASSNSLQGRSHWYAHSHAHAHAHAHTHTHAHAHAHAHTHSF